MTSSLISNIQNESIMAQSFDSSILPNNNRSGANTTIHDICSAQSNLVNQLNGSQLVAASKMVPVPESLMSPDCSPFSVIHRTSLNVPNASSYNSTYTKSSKTKGL